MRTLFVILLVGVFFALCAPFQEPRAQEAPVEAVRFEKWRETWRLQGCRIELDEVPYLGCYIEIEGAAERAVRQAQETLGFGAEPVIRDSYIGLLVDYCSRHGLSPTALTFDESAR